MNRAIVAALFLFLALTANAQTSACYDGICYSSKPEAEAAMRADPTYGPYLKQVSSRIVANSATSATEIIRYDVSDIPPTHIYGARYAMSGWAVNELGCTPSETHPTLCGNEAEMISLFISYWKNQVYATCTIQNEQVTGSYAAPFNRVTSNYTGSSGNTGILDYDTGSPAARRRWEFQIHCPGWTSPNFDPRVHTIYKQATFQCPIGFYAKDGWSPGYAPAGSTALVYWPNLCRPATAFKEIRVTVSQVASCATKNPCHPTTGDKSRVEQDFDFAGRPFVRNYHSLQQIQSVGAAPGWSHTYSERLDFLGTNPTFNTSQGYFENFTALDSTHYRGNQSTDKLLEKGGDGKFRLMDASGEIKTFSGSSGGGKLLSISNPSNAASNVTLTYQGESLLSVTDSNGRSLYFYYSVLNGQSKPLLSQIDLPDGSSVVYGYDSDRNLVTADYGNGQVKTYHYHEAGLAAPALVNQLTGITQEDGTRYGTFAYDMKGRVISSALHGVSGSVEDVSLAYNSDTNVTVTSALGDARTYVIEPSLYRRILSVTDGAGTKSYSYSAGKLQASVDAKGVSTSYSYTNGYRSGVSEAVGTTDERRTAIERDAKNRITKRTIFAVHGGIQAPKSISSFAYDADGRLIYSCRTDPAVSTAVSYVCGAQESAPAGVRQTGYAYCSTTDVVAGICPLVGLTKSINAARTDLADLTSYTYYADDDTTCVADLTICPHRKGDLWKITNALSQVVAEYLKYDGAGRVLSSKDVNDIITDLEYHPRGWLTARKVRGANDAVETDDVITRIEYWPTGLVKKVIQPDGAFTTYTYDAAHHLTDIADNAGNTIHYTLDNAGNRTQEDTKDPGGTLKRTLSRVYNQLGQLQTQADAQANPTDFTYDANGNADTVSDALARVTDNDYDPLNRLSRTLQDVGGIDAETKFTYDALDNLTQVTDPKGLNTGYTYNGLGDLTQLSSPDTGTTTYTYDSAGNRQTQTDARGQTSTYSYDALNRLTGIAYATPSLDVAYTYDASQTACATGETFSIGRLTQLADASGTTQYCYDRFGNLVRKVQTTNGIAFTVRYAYTLAGQLSSVTYPDGAIASYVRDAQGRTTQVNVQRAGAAIEVLLDQASYHPFGPIAGWTYGNGRQLLRPLNQNYQPTAVHDASTGGLSVGFQYDPVGNLTELTPAVSTTPLVKFDYDALSRLTAFKDGPTDVAIENYVYDATGNRLSFTNAAGTQAYAYPSTSHRLSQVGAVARTYDNAGNTTTIGGTTKEFNYDDTGRMSQVMQNAIVQRNYAYNGKGEQVRKYLGTSNTYTVYDEAGHWLGDYDNTGVALQQAIWLDDLPVGLIANGNQLHYLEPDHLGTPRVVIEVARNVPVWKWDLRSEAFGNGVQDQDPDGDTNPFVFDMRFPGQRYDAASGLNQNGFRDGYDPGTGRYTQSDPIGLQGGASSYGYVFGNPLFYIDPLGLKPNQTCVAGWIASCAAVVGTAGFIGGGLLGGAAGTAVTPIAGTAAGAIGGAELGGLGGAAAGGLAGGLIGSAVCPDEKKQCPPCQMINGQIVAVGTIGYRLDRVPPSAPHYPFKGDHYNLLKANQNPNNCQCFWQPVGAADAAGGLPPPPGAIIAFDFIK